MHTHLIYKLEFRPENGDHKETLNIDREAPRSLSKSRIRTCRRIPSSEGFRGNAKPPFPPTSRASSGAAAAGLPELRRLRVSADRGVGWRRGRAGGGADGGVLRLGGDGFYCAASEGDLGLEEMAAAAIVVLYYSFIFSSMFVYVRVGI